MKILFLGAPPGHGGFIYLQSEAREISGLIQADAAKIAVEIVLDWPRTTDMLQKALISHQPDIVHFSGCGEVIKDIIFEGKDGTWESLSKRIWSTSLRQLKDKIRIVLLNGYQSEKPLNAFTEATDFVVGIGPSAVGKSAAYFCASFYQALALGCSVKDAFNLAVNQLTLPSASKTAMPKLFTRRGGNASTANFISSSMPEKIIRKPRKNEGTRDIDLQSIRPAINIRRSGLATIIKIFYATDRKPGGVSTPDQFYSGERSADESLALGSCEISIPHRHKLGELESPSIWKLQFREDSRKHVVLLKVSPQNRSRFFSALSARVAQSTGRDLFVFIHGYNMTFKDAARRTAQLAYDLQFEGAPVLYSWPSKGNWAAYAADEATVEWTVPHLKNFLAELAAKSAATTIHLIAHSMGNRALTKALERMAVEQPPVRLPMFNQVVLTAPDIDAGVFHQLAQTIRRTADNLTLYASSGDRALALSKRFHQYPRAGESGDHLVIADGVETIDASAVVTEFLGHSYYGNNPSVVADLYWLLKNITPPGKRFRMVLIEQGGKKYWAFRP